MSRHEIFQARWKIPTQETRTPCPREKKGAKSPPDPVVLPTHISWRQMTCEPLPSMLRKSNTYLSYVLV